MSVLKTLWGLLVDDARLAGAIGVTLVLAFGLREAGLPLVAAIVLWAGLLGALWFSTEHQLRLARAGGRDGRR